MDKPLYSIVVPAFNEEHYLPHSLAAIRKAMDAFPDLMGEVVVTDNNSTDRTAEVARTLGATVVFEPINQISRARNAGAKAAQGDWLVFVDADATLTPALLGLALTNLKNGHSGGGAAIGMDEKLPLSLGWSLHVCNAILTTAHIPAGCFIYCTKEAFTAIGGFNEAVYATEEMYFGLAMRRYARRTGQPFRVVWSPKMISSARKVHWFGAWSLLKHLILLTFYPPAARSRAACGMWYDKTIDGKKGPASHG
jgi:glycosyltransferase involved in cell wall biosynthesis